MKMRLSGVVASLLISFSFPIAITYVTAEENVNDGLSKEFLDRALKAAAVAGLSSEPLLDWNPGWIERTAYLNTFDGNDTVRKLYTEEGVNAGRDDAVLVEHDGQCFVGFQATQWLGFTDLSDWLQNAGLFCKTLCNSVDECCTFREGFVDAWNTQWKDELIADVTRCVEGCDKDVCLIISGHSQGGAVATAASIQLADITDKYEVITYAAPPALTVEPDSCSPQMNFRKHYRFGKALYKPDVTGGVAGLLFDKVSFLGPDPLPLLNTYPVGEFIIISSEDAENVAYVGYNSDLVLTPWDHSPMPLGRAHDLYYPRYSDDTTTESGYFQLIKFLANSVSSLPAGVEGFQNNMHCGNSENGVLLCASDRCDRANGELHPTCKRKLDNGERCNADTDCLSGRCPSRFPSECEDKAGPGERCANNNDCIDGYYCPAGFNRKCRAL